MLSDLMNEQQEQDVRALQTFLYILIRDHLPSGTVHGILVEHTSKGDPEDEQIYSNPFLAADAYTLAKAILNHCTFRQILNLRVTETPVELISQTEARMEIERTNDP